jgi:type I restriction enzyme, S subunit
VAEFDCLYSEVLLTRNAWEKRKLGEIAGIFDGTHQTPNYQSSGIMFLSVENIQTLKSNKFISLEDFQKDFKVSPRTGDILMTRIGNIGTTNVVKSTRPIAYYVSLALIRPNDAIDVYYLNYAINGLSFQRELRRRTLSVAFPQKINKQEIGKSIVDLPSPSEQIQIGNLFVLLDNLIAATQNKIDALEQVKETLSKNLFDQLWRFKEYSTSWKENKLKDIVSAYSGGTPSANIRTYYGGHIPFIRSAEIHSSTTALTLTQEGLKNSSAKLVKTGDILYALYGANSGDVDRSKINGAINQAILAMRPSKENDSNFILFQLMRMKNKIVSTYLQGGQGNLSGRIILALNLDMPESTSEQRTIGRSLQLLCELISINQSKYSQLESLKKSLLQNLFV